ncbi:MAG TPA: glycosyltransferase family 39 protein [Candidatus Paceibacterota bacterium]|nr:glycosyltransferase family 39 protein [Verrucomicrobiota bacterium]HSA11409.1 glycosyltransferase family 39 protein [Candidatus Paceibacterota bacterium]
MLNQNTNSACAWRDVLWRHRGWLLVALVVLFVLVVRVRLRGLPLERDEGEYAYAGQLILQGVPPYKVAYNMKLPGTYAAYAVIMAIFGQSPSGIRLGLALVNAVSIVLVFRLGRRLLDEATGISAAAAFALLSLSPFVLGLAGHATHFIVLAALGGIWLLLRALEHPAIHRPRHWAFQPSALLFASGLLFGLAFLMKQHGIFFGLFGVLYLLWVRGGEWLAAGSTRGRRLDVRNPRERTGEASFAGPARIAADLGWFALGWLAPYGLTCLVLWWAGAFPQFVFWTISYAREYASAISPVNGPAMLRAGLRAAVGPNLILWLLPWIGLLVLWWDERLSESSPRSAPRSPKTRGQWPGAGAGGEEAAIRKSQVPHPRFFLTALLFCSFASASVGLYFREHYFITVLPVLALLTGVAVSRGLHLLRHDQTIELFLAVPILGLFAIALGAALIGQGSVWLTLPRDRALRSVFGSTLFAGTAQAADYLRAHTAKDTRVAVLGSEPQIYFLSRRRSATGYIYMYPLMEAQPFALRMQEEMIAEVERARPEYVVYIDDDFSWLSRPASARKVAEWWADYWAANLDLVMTIEVREGHERGTDMDKPAPGASTVKHILILKRRPSPEQKPVAAADPAGLRWGPSQP